MDDVVVGACSFEVVVTPAQDSSIASGFQSIQRGCSALAEKLDLAHTTQSLPSLLPPRLESRLHILI